MKKEKKIENVGLDAKIVQAVRKHTRKTGGKIKSFFELAASEKLVKEK